MNNLKLYSFFFFVILFLVTVLGLLFAVEENRQIQLEDPRYDTFELELSRSVCFGHCPSYTISVHSNGEVTYNGEYFVNVTGEQSYTISAKKVQNIREALITSQFLDFEYPDILEKILDAPRHSIVFSSGNNEKSIQWTWSATGFEKFEELADIIDKETGILEFIKCDNDLGYCTEP